MGAFLPEALTGRGRAIQIEDCPCAYQQPPVLCKTRSSVFSSACPIGIGDRRRIPLIITFTTTRPPMDLTGTRLHKDTTDHSRSSGVLPNARTFLPITLYRTRSEVDGRCTVSAHFR
ncbi:hypothetical protein BJX76DRAFT_326019 [Aspergillus varians]